MKLQNFIQMEIADKNGESTPQFTRFLGDFSSNLQNAFIDEGYLLPALTTAQIAQLDADKSINRMFINSDTNQLIVNLGGVFKTVQTV